MAKKKEPDQKGTSRNYDKGRSGVVALLNQLSTSLYGTDTSDETDTINDRFNQIMTDELNRLTFLVRFFHLIDRNQIKYWIQ